MSRNATKPGLTAAMTAGRALLAAGWRYDSTSPMANDTTIRTLLHPTGREIHARTVDGAEQTDLTMTGLSLEQVAGAVAGAGLGEPVAPTGPHAELVAGLRALADFIEANPTMPPLTYPNLLDTGPVRESDADGVARVHFIAGLLGTTVQTSRAGHLSTARQFAGLGLRVAHVPSESQVQHEAHMSYADNVQPEPQDGHVYSCCGKTGRISRHESWCTGGAR